MPEGEFVSVVGPSGCGKSTILKMLAGIVPLSGGTIAIEGERLTGPSEKVGVVFQSPVLLPWRTVYDNVLLPSTCGASRARERGPRARALVELVGLDGFEDRYPFELSGGMQQRVAICRALITDPAILLMDEPFGALDAMTREHMNLELQRIWLEKRKTVLLITHSIPEAVFLSDRVIVMTSRPGTIDEIVEIDLPRPRELDMTSDERFGRYAKRIRAQVRQRRQLRLKSLARPARVPISRGPETPRHRCRRARRGTLRRRHSSISIPSPVLAGP